MSKMEGNVLSQIKIERPLYEHDQLRQDLCYQKPRENILRAQCAKEEIKIKKIFSSIVPAIGWLSHYKWKKDIVADLVAGFTVAIMHIPQGMAYALLGNVAPVVGIYMAFFPVLVYFFFGTSRHNSMGTFAVICLMTGKAVLEYSDPKYFEGANVDPSQANMTTSYTPIEVATAVTFLVAIFQILMYILRLGAVSALLSETLVSGFTTGAAVQVMVSQIKYLFGLNVHRFTGYFIVYKTMRGIILELPNTNYASLIISAVTITITAFNNEVIKPWVAKRTTIPVPIELIAVVVGSLVSTYCNFQEVYGIKIVGDIPVGLPEPTLPQFSLMSSLLVDAISIAIVSYTITLSMGLIFAQKLDYEVDANQELLAMGSGNIVGSFFSCMPVCASLSRSVIQQVVGGKSQIVSIVSCSILVVILLWIGPFFEPLPKAVLASVIVVALKSMIMQVTEVWKFWKLSKMDALVWMITFLTVVFVSIDIGLLVGVIMSLVTIFILGFKPYTCLLGRVPRTDLYLDITRYKGTEEIKGLKIFHYCGGLNFATRNIFKNDLYKLVQINPQKEVIYRKKLEQETEEQGESKDKKIKKLQGKVNTEVKCVIIDCSSVSYIDPSGISMLKNVVDSFQKLNISVYFAGSSDNVYRTMERCDLVSSTKANLRFFACVHDAVQSSIHLLGLHNPQTIIM